VNIATALLAHAVPSADSKDGRPIAIAGGKEHLVRIHPDNATSKDWVVLLEAATIVGSSSKRLRVARTMREPTIVKKYDMFLRAQHFIVVEGYNPRIHAVYFCPQLYKDGPDHKLVPLQGEEIGRLIADSFEGGIKERRPWYEPSEKLPNLPIISGPMQKEFDTLIVETPREENSDRPATQNLFRRDRAELDGLKDLPQEPQATRASKSVEVLATSQSQATRKFKAIGPA
jgi:hypothetical protein